MTTYYLKCTLLSDLVLNSKLATEGNMSTLDYIPGSNFLGIAAKYLYEKAGSESAYELFHSGKVKFGDARVATSEGHPTYSVPFSFFQDKLNAKLENDPIYLHHLITSENHPKDAKETRLQLQQSRAGYISAKGMLVKEVDKRFSLKSAYDRENRTSRTGYMFGFEAIPSGTDFIFSVTSDDQALLNQIVKVLDGDHRLGKSKTAEYGQVKIEKMDDVDPLLTFSSTEYTLVYAESNLCFLDEAGQPSFQPSVADLGLIGGVIDWSKSQIRTYSYAPWNGQRKTTSTQRHCIVKGSVFYVKDATTTSKEFFVGHHQAEGLGKVVYNPIFLESKAKEVTSPFKINLDGKANSIYKEGKVITPLAEFLKKQKNHKTIELLTSELVTEYVYAKVLKEFKSLKDVSSSQWGNIRSISSRAKNVIDLKNKLYDGKDAYLKHGVAYENCWGKNGESRLNNLKKIISEVEGKNNVLPANPDDKGAPKIDLRVFLAKFSSEMAKQNKN